MEDTMSIRRFHWIRISILISILISGCNRTALMSTPTIEPTPQPALAPTIEPKLKPTLMPTTTATTQTNNQTDWSLVPIDVPNDTRVYDIATVPDGSAWFATGAGMWRYDGQAWQVDPSPPSKMCFSVSSNAKTGLVVAACFGGLYRWNGLGWESISDKAPEILGQVGVFGLHLQDDGRLWMGVINPEMGYTPGLGAIRYDGKQWSIYSSYDYGFKDVKMETAGIPFTDVVNIVSEPAGKIWLETNVGISSFDGKTWQHYTFSDLTGQVLVQDEKAVHKISGLSGMVAATDGAIWVGTPYGAARFDGASWKLYTPDLPAVQANVIIYPLTAGRDGSVWFIVQKQPLAFRW
jgi:ligand-binding sensor domain-containing protein